MSKNLFVSSAGVLALALASCVPPVQDVEKEIAALKQVDSVWEASFVKGDIDGIMSTYWNSPELVSYPPNTMEVNGYEAVRMSYEKMYGMMAVKSAQSVNASYKVSGDVAFGWGTWKMTFQPTGGQDMGTEGRYTNMYVKKDGKWYYAVDHASVPMPPPAPPMEMKKKK